MPIDWIPEEWLGLVARSHVAVQSVPIGLLFAVWLVEFASWIKKDVRGLRRVLGALWVASAIAAVLSGVALAAESESSLELQGQHERIAYVTGGGILLFWLLDLFARGPLTKALRMVMLLVATTGIIASGHLGGALTHGEDWIREVAPKDWAPILDWRPGADDEDGATTETADTPELDSEVPSVDPTPTSVATIVDPPDHQSTPVVTPPREADPLAVFALLEAKCFACHAGDDAQGGTRFDLAQEYGWVINPERPDESSLFERVLLPASSRRAMPPEGPRLDENELATLRDWLHAGAPLDQLEAFLDARDEAESPKDERNAWARDRGALLESIRDSEFLDLDFSQGTDPIALEGLDSIAPLVNRLSFAGRELESAALENLPRLTALESLHLERSNIDRAGLERLLEAAPNLRELNLFQTSLTDDVVEVLARSTALDKLVVGQTSISDRALSALPPSVRVAPREPSILDESFGYRQPRRILAADPSKRRVALLRETAIGRAETLWEHEVEAIHDLAWLGDTQPPHGRVLFQTSWTEILEVDTATGEVLWRYDAAASGEGAVEVHSFQRMGDGRTLVAESGRGRIVFVDAEGAIQHTIALERDAPDLHHDTRLVRFTPTGTYLVAHESEGVVREYHRDGTVLWEYSVPLFDRERADGHGPEAHGNQVFCAKRLDNGDTLVTTGNGSSLLRLDSKGKLVSRLTDADLGGIRLAWVTTIQELSEGRLVLGNCHAGPEQPQAIELSPAGEVLWTFRDFERFGDSLCAFHVIEEAR